LNDIFDHTLAKIHPAEESSAWSFYLLIVLGILCFIVTVTLCYRRMLKNETKSEIGVQVNKSISNYFALNDTNSSSKKWKNSLSYTIVKRELVFLLLLEEKLKIQKSFFYYCYCHILTTHLKSKWMNRGWLLDLFENNFLFLTCKSS